MRVQACLGLLRLRHQHRIRRHIGVPLDQGGKSALALDQPLEQFPHLRRHGRTVVVHQERVAREAFVAWAWAVNGFCSVVSSVLATLLSMTIGFDGVMACGAGLYVVGIFALRRLGRSTPAGTVALLH